MQKKREYDATTAYKQSKQANRMITKSAAAELFAGGGVTVMACHPGVVTSPLLQNLGVQR
ncbi:hypothetical protein T484DRAFT_1818945 [Baffinella frigidus]|nr:hypothetical protein T484DRAFT_1818945 [Cryptophyta sp. CCMP2293]